MHTQKKLFLTFSVLILVTLACTTVMGNGNTPDQPAQPPNDNPLPPPPTSTPLPTNTPQPEQPPAKLPVPTGEVLFYDDFSDSTSGWDQYSIEDGFTDYADGAYQIRVNKPSYYFWANPYMDFGDVIIEVDVTKLSGGDDSQFGIVCRHLDINNWYALVATSDGQVAIRKRLQGGELVNLTDWVSVSAINQGNAINTLRAECVGSRLTLFVNGVLAIEANDSDVSTGDVGLLGGTFDEADNVDFQFDNFKVYAPLEGGAAPIDPGPVALPGAGPDFEVLNTVFLDDFSDNGNSWDIYDDGEANAELSQGGYLVSLNVAEKFAGGFPNLVTITDAALSVNATKLAGEDNQVSYGIICHYQDGTNWHALLISASGYAVISKAVDGSVSELTDWVQIPDGFNLGNQKNNLIASCSGDRLALYVNSIGVVEYIDPEIAPGGTYGLIIRTHEETDAQVLFDNFRIAVP